MSDCSRLNALMTPFNIGKETIKNRFLMGPMGFGKMYNSDGTIPENTMDYFVERAKGGFGAIFTGVNLVDTKIDPKAMPSPMENPMRYYSLASRMTERAAAYGTKMIGELGLGVGRNYPGAVSPSPVEVWRYPNIMGKEITKDQIKSKVDSMVQGAMLFKRAGFAAVDVHTLHWGYLLDEFVLAITNKREDEYGGTLENRMRIVREIVRGIKEACGEDYPVTIGLGVKTYIKALNKASLTGEEEAGRTLEESIEIVKMLEEMGIDAIMADTGAYDSFYYACPPSYLPKGHGLELYAEIKKHVSIPVMARSRMGDPFLCADALEKGQADAFVLARPAFADPFFARKVEIGKPESIRPCIACNIGCVGSFVDTGKEPSCAVNPRAARELYTRPKKAVNPRRIAIVGGGAAGMQAAITAAECGHYAELFEKTGVLGGEMIPAGAHESKVDVSRLREWFIWELKDKKIPVHLNTEFKPEMAENWASEGKFDTVILAVGASAVMPKSIEGIDKAVSAVDLLTEGRETGKYVVVVGAGMVGCETAVELAKEGKKVTLVEAMPDIMKGEFVPTQHDMMLRDMIEHYGIDVITDYKLMAVRDKVAVLESTKAEEGKAPSKMELAADDIVISIGLRPNPSMRQQLVGKGLEIHEIGSGRHIGAIYNAVHDAFEVVYGME